VKLLLDTHAIIWWQRDDRRLKRAAREAIATAAIVWVSAASGWELFIKAALGRVRISEPFAALLAADDFTELPITLAHAARLETLPHHHRDPFDRVIIAQALEEGATIVTSDPAFERYGAPLIRT
jgi:PIN domain nuclease of toxin-antitoxin system